jgi:hypothetical protein
VTSGHTHRKVKAGRLVIWLFTRPTLLVVGTEYADKSRMVFGPTKRPDRWRLSPLGLLHGWTGLTLIVKEDNKNA